MTFASQPYYPMQNSGSFLPPKESRVSLLILSEPLLESIWRSEGFRDGVFRKLQQAVDRYGNVVNKSALDMEEHIFERARTKEEYLENAARIIVYIKNSSRDKTRHEDVDEDDEDLEIEADSDESSSSSEIYSHVGSETTPNDGSQAYSDCEGMHGEGEGQISGICEGEGSGDETHCHVKTPMNQQHSQEDLMSGVVVDKEVLVQD